jgi:hypothetical protein
MVETFIPAVIAFVVGAIAGAGWAVLGWAKSGDAFEAKKFVLGIVTGVIAAVVLTLAQVASIVNITDPTQQLYALIGLVLAIGGADTLRTGISGAIANRALEEKPTS